MLLVRRREQATGDAMTANDSFFQQKQAAAVLKHGILSRYVHVFASMTGVGSREGRVWFVDGYAGPGRYEPEDGAAFGAPGSPLLAIKTAADLSVKSSARDLRCIFIEVDETYADNLRAVLEAEAPHAVHYQVIQGEVETHLRSALALVASDPLLVFLDPFGTSLPFELLCEILRSRASGEITEVLLNFNLLAVSRIGGLLEGEDGRCGRGTSDATLARVDQFLGGAWWRDVFRAAREGDAPGEASRAAAAVADEFRKRVLASTGYLSMPVPIRRRPNHRPLFLLTLFYRHEAAPYQFAEAASGANEDWRRFNRALDLEEDVERNLDTLFDRALCTELSEREATEAEAALEAQWIEIIESNIRELLTEHDEVPVASEVLNIFGRTLALAREKHLRKAWDNLTAAGLVEPRQPSIRMRNLSIRRAPATP